jgi:hypothetical protein
MASRAPISAGSSVVASRRRFAAARWRSFVALAIAAAAFAARARAQDALDEAPVDTLSEQPQTETAEDADRKARDLFKQGRAAYEEGRYRDAWDYFRQAYLLSKRPELLYNVGQSADRLRMDREALDAFKLYLAKLPDAENRREVENRVRALEERLGPQASQDASPQPEEPDPAYLTGAGQDEGAIFGEEPKAEEAAAPGPSDGQPTRTGWQLRLALGLGLLGSSVSDLAIDTTIGSATAVGHLSLGYDLAQGVVLGGALMFEWGLNPGATQNDLTVDLNTANMVLVGPFLDYYFAPRKDGWHALAGLALARLSLSDTSGTVSSEDATGGGLFLGGGYEWPAFDDEWAIGVFGRLILATVGQDTGQHAIAAFSVSGTAVWY